MKLLPHWVLTDTHPAFYDSESATAIEQTARVYAAMQTLISEYNSFVDSVNNHISDFENAAKKDYEVFTTDIRQEFQDFIDVVTLKIQSQDSIIQDAVSYMRENLSKSIESVLLEMRTNGGFSQEVLKVYSDMTDQIASLNSRMNTFTTLEGGSTTGDAELIDGRTDHTGKIWPNIGDHIRGVTGQLSNNFSKYLSLESDDAIVIPDGTDFNTLTEPITYKVRTWSSGSTMINAPTKNNGRLIVMRVSEWPKILQIYVANETKPSIYSRLKDGEWSEWVKLVTSDIIDDLLDNWCDYYPDYYTDTLTEKVRKINSEMSSIGFSGGDAFVFITDTHEKPTYTADTMKHICDHTNISKIIHGGDAAKDKETKEKALEAINKYYNLYRLNGCTLYKVVGNHEFNNGGANEEYADRQLSENELFMTILGDNANKITYDPAGTLAYYFDNPVKKIRYFVNSVNYKSTVSLDGIKWIIAELENVPADYDIIVFCHHGLSSSGYTTYMSYLTNCLDAYKAHSTYTYALGDKTYNFTDKSGDVICVCVGDEHMDLSKISDGGIPVIATTCASSEEELGGLTRTPGTVNEGAYDVYVINKATRTIHITRIGAGSDREFTY